MPATEEQKATWRAQRAFRAGRQPTPEDQGILGAVKLEEIQNRVEQNPTTAPQTPHQQNLPQGVPLTPLQLPQMPTPSKLPSDGGSTSSEPAGEELKKEVKRVSQSEREWTLFFKEKFGPFIVLILFVFMRDWNKATFYAPSPKECFDLSGPFARIAIKLEQLFSPPKWVRAVIVTSDDVMTVGYVLTSYLERTGLLDNLLPWFSQTTQAVKEKYEQPAGDQRTGYAGNVPTPAVLQPTSNGTGPINIPDSQLGAIGSQWAPGG